MVEACCAPECRTSGIIRMTSKTPELSDAEARAYLSAIIESSDDAIIGLTLQGIITTWNQSASRIFGFTPNEAIGQHIALIIPPGLEDEELVILGKVSQGNRVDHFETKRRNKNGQLVDISLTVSPIRNSDGIVIGASKVARDITALKIAEKANAHLAAIVGSSEDAIISKNLDGHITSWNGAAERMFGYTPEEAIGQHVTLIIPPELVDEEYAILGKVKSGRKVEHFETVRRRKDGSAISISLTVSPIFDTQGRIIGASKVARDVTQHRKTEEALRESNRRKDEFLASISHELRTPMNAIIGLSNILSMSGALSGKEKQYVETLQTSAQGLMALINNLLDFSRLGAGSVELEQVEFSLPELVSRTLDLLRVKADEKDIQLHVLYTAPLPKKYIGDAFRLQQVLTNLVANAIKFTEHGSVEVRITAQRQERDACFLIIDVVDTGIGIPADKQQLIFEKFTQADASMTRKYGGSGLGLSICKALVESMGGSISVESRVGLGSTFTVGLPLRRVGLDLVETVTRSGNRPHRNVLVVDDYMPNLLVVTALLDHLGYDYDTAENGLEAVRRFQSSSYDLVLMDVQMHDMDGYESTRRIRAFEKERQLAQTPVIAMTAHVLERDREKCIESGMTDFVPKPFDPEVLTAMLGMIIPRKAAIA